MPRERVTLRNPGRRARAMPSLTLPDALEYVISVKKAENLRERTLRDYRTYFTAFIEWMAERYPDVKTADEVSAEHIRHYAEYLRYEKQNGQAGGVGLSAYTVNVRLRIIKAVFNALRREGAVARDPSRSVKLLRTEEKRIETLTDDELRALLNAPDKRLYAQFRDLVAIYIMLDTGIRSKELFALELEDVNISSHCIVLPANKSKNRRVRVLPLSPPTVRLIMELIAENKAAFPGARWLFLNDKGERYRESGFRKRLQMYRERAGITKPVSPHLLRKHFLITYLRNGGDLFSAQRILGHADLSTTRRYWDASTEEIKERHAMFSPIGRLTRRKRP